MFPSQLIHASNMVSIILPSTSVQERVISMRVNSGMLSILLVGTSPTHSRLKRHSDDLIVCLFQESTPASISERHSHIVGQCNRL